MPCRYVIDKERRLVISTGWGKLTYEEIQSHDDQLRQDPDFNPDFDNLVDGQGITELQLSAEQAGLLANRRLFSSTARRALVAPLPEAFGMARMIFTLNEMSPVASLGRPFYDMPSALQWLGLKPDSLQPAQ